MQVHSAVFITALVSLATFTTNPTIHAASAPSAYEQTQEEREWETLESVAAVLQSLVDAARELASRAAKAPEPEKAAARFDVLGSKFATDAQLRRVLAGCIGKCDSPETQKMLAKSMLTGQTFEKLFRLRAAYECAPGVVTESALKLLGDKEVVVRREALTVLVRHKHAPVLKNLESLLKAGKDEEMLAPAVDAMSVLIGTGEGWSAWETQLLAYAVSPDADLRRASLAVLARKQDAARLQLFIDTLQHPDWSSRAIALAWLARSNSKEAVAKILELFRAEPYGSRLAADCGDTLRRMTNQPLDDDPAAWTTWWNNVQSTFEFPKATGPKTGGVKRPEASSGTQAPQYYGIEVRSQRIVFVIDVSGSMKEAMVGAEDQGTPRIDVARRELTKIIEALQPAARFNVISSSDSVVPWLDGVDESADVGTGGKGGAKKGPATGPRKKDERDEKTRARDAEKQKEADDLLRKKAAEYVSRLNADGGTNIHDALEEAFADPSVDTIFFLSDGMPSAGREVDAAAIRRAVKGWNDTRRLKINSIALGMDLPLLKWIAEDSGGEYKYLP